MKLRTAPLAVGAMVLVGAVSGQAVADTATIRVTTSEGRDDPAAKVSRVFTITGNVTAPSEVFVKHRETGGAPCAPTAVADSGEYLSDFANYDHAAANGDFALRSTMIWTDPGSEMFCTWLALGASAATTPITQVIDFRLPFKALSVSQNPAPATAQRGFTITLSGSVEAPTGLFASLVAAGAGCGATLATDQGYPIHLGSRVEGAFSVVADAPPRAAGDYAVCAWVADSIFDDSPGSEPQRFPIRVAPSQALSSATAIAVVLPRRTRVNQGVVITARVTTIRAIPSGSCVVQRYRRGGWTNIARGEISPEATCRVTVRLGRRGVERLRVRVRGRVSGPRMVRVS